jgi:hypothetical protein
MAAVSNPLVQTTYDFDAEKLDLSQLVGHEISLFPEQRPGQSIRTKVLSATAHQILLEGGARFDELANLVNRQSTVMTFRYRGEQLSVKAQFQRTTGGRCYLTLDDKVTPLSQRRFARVRLNRTARLAAYPIRGLQTKHLDRLRWIETETIDVSSGGALLSLSSILDTEVYLLLNIDLGDVGLPPLVLGQVKHCYQTDDKQFRVGIEFIVSELARKVISPARLPDMPPVLFTYGTLDREHLNRRLSAKN